MFNNANYEKSVLSLIVNANWSTIHQTLSFESYSERRDGKHRDAIDLVTRYVIHLHIARHTLNFYYDDE
jgi:hypothetical protein